MTIFDSKDRAVARFGYLLYNGEKYTEAELREILKQHKEIKEAEEKFKKSGVLIG
jgi:hypothetical protein